MEPTCDKYTCGRPATVIQSIRGEDYPVPLCDEHRLQPKDPKLIGEEDLTTKRTSTPEKE